MNINKVLEELKKLGIGVSPDDVVWWEQFGDILRIKIVGWITIKINNIE